MLGKDPVNAQQVINYHADQKAERCRQQIVYPQLLFEEYQQAEIKYECNDRDNNTAQKLNGELAAWG